MESTDVAIGAMVILVPIVTLILFGLTSLFDWLMLSSRAQNKFYEAAWDQFFPQSED